MSIYFLTAAVYYFQLKLYTTTRDKNSHIILKDWGKKGVRIIPMFRSWRCFVLLCPKGMVLLLYLTDSARYKIVPRYTG